MTLTYAGTIVELGGEELGASGKPKPRKVKIKSDPNAQYGKTFRVWQDSDAWQQLSTRNGQWVTVIYEAEEREGPSGPYTQNMIVGIDAPEGSDGVGAPPQGSGLLDPAEQSPTPSDSWGPPPDDWGRPINDPPLAAVQARMTTKMSKEDYWAKREAQDEARTKEIEAAWGITNALSLLDEAGRQVPDRVHEVAHQLIVLKHRIAKELAE